MHTQTAAAGGKKKKDVADEEGRLNINVQKMLQGIRDDGISAEMYTVPVIQQYVWFMKMMKTEGLMFLDWLHRLDARWLWVHAGNDHAAWKGTTGCFLPQFADEAGRRGKEKSVRPFCPANRKKGIFGVGLKQHNMMIIGAAYAKWLLGGGTSLSRQAWEKLTPLKGGEKAGEREDALEVQLGDYELLKNIAFRNACAGTDELHRTINYMFILAFARMRTRLADEVEKWTKHNWTTVAGTHDDNFLRGTIKGVNVFLNIKGHNPDVDKCLSCLKTSGVFSFCEKCRGNIHPEHPCSTNLGADTPNMVCSTCAVLLVGEKKASLEKELAAEMSNLANITKLLTQTRHEQLRLNIDSEAAKHECGCINKRIVETKKSAQEAAEKALEAKAAWKALDAMDTTSDATWVLHPAYNGEGTENTYNVPGPRLGEGHVPVAYRAPEGRMRLAPGFEIRFFPEGTRCEPENIVVATVTEIGLLTGPDKEVPQP